MVRMRRPGLSTGGRRRLHDALKPHVRAYDRLMHATQVATDRSIACIRHALNQATQHWDTPLVRWTMLLPPGVGEAWDRGVGACNLLPGSAPPPWPSPVEREGSLCANPMWSDCNRSGRVGHWSCCNL